MFEKNSNYRFVLSGLIITVLAALSIVSSPAGATHTMSDKWQQSTWNDDHVIVFSECGFAGLAKSLPLGDYPNVRRVGVDNNAISSIIIPPGMAVELFQRRKFGGHWYRLNQNQICLKGNWNDQVRSLRVLDDEPNNSFGFNDGTEHGNRNGKCHRYSVVAEYGDGGIRFVDHEDRLSLVRPGQPLQSELCLQGPVRVEMAKTDREHSVTFTVNGEEYRFGSWEQHDNYQGNLFRKYITVQLPEYSQVYNQQKNHYGQNGWGNTQGFGKRYSSGMPNGSNWGNNYPQNWNKRVVKEKNSNVPKATSTPTLRDFSGGKPDEKDGQKCTSYTVSANHADTGFRFLVGENEFNLIGVGSRSGEICHSGQVQIELAKKRPPAEVVLRVGSKVFAFRSGDQGTRLVRDWYRRYYTVNLH